MTINIQASTEQTPVEVAVRDRTTTKEPTMASPISTDSDTFPGLGPLPTELRRAVFGFIRTPKDRSNVRLVCRQWSDLMSPQMWACWTTNLQNTEKRQIGDLLHPNANVLRHVRGLWVSYVRGEERQLDYNLRFIIRGLTPDTLEGFAGAAWIETSSFLQLLHSQRKMRWISGWLDLADVPSQISRSDWLNPHMSWIPYSLKEMDDVSVNVYDDGDYTHCLAQARFFLANSPKLTQLTISSNGQSANDKDLLPDLLAPPDLAALPLWKLRKLDLTKVDLRNLSGSDPENSSQIVPIKGIDLTGLKELYIHRSINFGPFLIELARLQREITPQLDIIDIRFLHESEDVTQLRAVETLLNAAKNLSTIWVDSAKTGQIGKASILQHRETLKCLLLQSDVMTPPIHHSVADIQAIINACSSLEQLGVNFPDAKLGNIDDCDVTWNLDLDVDGHQVKNELHGMLETIASAPLLHTLRILSAPELEDHDMKVKMDKPQSNYAQAIFQNYANHVMQYLVNSGSNIKVLALSPLRWQDGVSDADKDGQRYPNYYYTRDTSTNSKGKTQILASPMKHCLAEMFESTILHYWITPSEMLNTPGRSDYVGLP